MIIGGSGTGKSVTLKCILGLLEPDKGSIKVDGEATEGEDAPEADEAEVVDGEDAVRSNGDADASAPPRAQSAR